MGTWPRTGTISVANGSKTVTGNLTTFLVFARPGDAILFAGSLKLYEVDTVDSNTEITLVDAFAEASLVDAGYVIIPLSYRHVVSDDVLDQLRLLIAAHTDVFIQAGEPLANVGGANSFSFDPAAGVFYYKVGGVWDGPHSLGGIDGADAGFRITVDLGSQAMANPGTGTLRFNHATLASATAAAISSQSADQGNPVIDALLSRWGGSTSAVKGTLLLRQNGTIPKIGVCDVTAAVDQTGWWQITIANLSTSTGPNAFADGDMAVVVFLPFGDKGDNGLDGVNAGMLFTFDDATAMSAPAAGALRFNHATPASVTAIAFADNSAEPGNPPIDSWVNSFGDSTTTNDRGELIIKKRSAPQNRRIYKITAAVTDNSGWSEVTVEHKSSAGTFDAGDPVTVEFSRTGDKGLDGLGAGDVIGPAGAVDGHLAAYDTTTGKLLRDSGVAASTDGTLAANSDALIPTQKAVKAYVDVLLAANDAMVFKGSIDASANPNYPAADAGHTYKISVAGKIGGASGPNVEAGDTIICTTDATAAGTQAGVGANWNIIQVNIDGAVIGPVSSTSGNIPTFNGAGGKTLQDSGKAHSTDGTFASNSDNKIPTEKAVKTYVDQNSGSVSFKNKLVNGAMHVAQRGTSFTSTGSANNDDTYNLDRWLLLSDGNNVVNVSQDTADVPAGRKYAWKATVVTVNKKFGGGQIIKNDDCIGLINNGGKVVTLSFQAKVSNVARLAKCKAVVLAWNSTADVVTSDFVASWGADGVTPTWAAGWTAENTPVNLNFTTSWQKFSLPATLDTASTKNLAVFIWSDNSTSTNADDTFHMTDVQFELGGSATDFEATPRDLELSRCLPHFELFDVGAQLDVQSGGDYGTIATWKAQKFALPEIKHVADIQHAGFNTGAPTVNTLSVYGARLSKAATLTATGRLWYTRISVTAEL